MESGGPAGPRWDPQSIVVKLLDWYGRVKRDLPWRRTADPYAILVSELMLQQTQVATVLPYFDRFMTRFPTVGALAAAPLEEVLKMWAGLGYYRRAKHLHQAAHAIVNDHAGAFPETVEGLLRLPGVGRYTAGAVASIAFGAAAPVLDGNVMRVLARVRDIHEDIGDRATQDRMWELAGELVAEVGDEVKGKRTEVKVLLPKSFNLLPRPTAGDLNQALMELGALVCVPGRPACLVCPIQAECGAFARGTQGRVPIKKAKAVVKTVRRTVVVLRKREEGGAGVEKVLLMRRPAGVVWEHLWEFPAFYRFTESAGLARLNPAGRLTDEVLSRVGLVVAWDKWRGRMESQLTHRKIVDQVYRGDVTGGEVILPACEKGFYDAFSWVDGATFGGLPVARVSARLWALGGAGWASLKSDG